MTLAAPPIPAYRPFVARAVQVLRLSPSFLRVTFTGPEFGELAPAAPDQRIKLLFPTPGRGLRDCPRGDDWYADWRSLPDDLRNPMRTYTVRAVRRPALEMDVDFVLHGAAGPASAWAELAAAGDELVLIGPNARCPGPTGGFEWRPPSDVRELVVAGDETAVPAVSAILESLPPGTSARALLEIPTHADVLDLDAPPGVEVTWLPRRSTTTTRPRGELLTAAVLEAATRLGCTAGSPIEPDHLPGDSLLWDVPPDGVGPSQPGHYVWLAGEAGVVATLRRRLLREVGLDRGSVAFMGYWREGRSSS
jgi:NADPH-dependent ferric siderophore reductase